MGPISSREPRASLLAGVPDVYPLEGSARPSDDELGAAGWRIARIGPVHDLGSFYTALAAALDLPSWFGRNLDALWDVLIDLGQPTVLELGEVRPSARARSKWDQLMDVLTERTRVPLVEAQPFAVILAARPRSSS